MGKIAQEWLEVFKKLEPFVRKGKRKVEGFVWGARVVEAILTLVIQRWEERNDGIHGNSTKSFSPVRRKRIEEEIRNLQDLREKACPRDAFLFLPDVKLFLRKPTPYSLMTYLSMTKKAILRSVKRWSNRRAAGVVLILGWLRNVPGNNDFIIQAEKRERQHWMDDRQKKRRK